MTTTIRAFIAIDLPTGTQKELAKVSQKLAQRVPGGGLRWVKPELIHLTLAFLGDTPTDKLNGIATAMDETTAAYERFRLSLGQAGCFPHCRQPRVVWVGLDGELEILFALQADLAEKLTRLGWEPDQQRYRPHLTIARVRRGTEVRKVPVNQVQPSSRFGVTAIHLFESQLRPYGPHYTIRHSSLLATGAS